MKYLSAIYDKRLGNDIQKRIELYKVLCSDFFQKYIPLDSTVLDLAAGYCEFINQIKAGEKIAVDVNPDTIKFANKNVRVINSTSINMSEIKDNSVDIAFTSNFFEHLSKEDIVKTIEETHRILKPNGDFLILQPNIRYCYKDYWMFYDHITPLDDRSLTEVFTVHNFEVIECIPRLLPYTTKSKLPVSPLLLKIYLRIPLLRYLVGSQAFIRAKKV